MHTLFEKWVYIRLSEHGTRFFYTVKYGRFVAITREVRLVEKSDTPEWAETSDTMIPCRVPLPARIARRGPGKP